MVFVGQKVLGLAAAADCPVGLRSGVMVYSLCMDTPVIWFFVVYHSRFEFSFFLLKILIFAVCRNSIICDTWWTSNICLIKCL